MNVARSFRLRVHNHATVTPSDATVYFTLSLSDLAAPPLLPGPIVRPFQGKTETQGWAFEVIDNADVITSRLATSGRMHLLGRIVTVEMQEDGGAWSTIGTARLANLSQPRGPGLYTLSLEDERWKERNSFVFTRSDTTSLWPQGLRHPFRRYPVVTVAQCKVTFIVGNWVALMPIAPTALSQALGRFPAYYRASRAVQELITSDAKADPPRWLTTATEGSFETLRAHVDGVEREILYFGTNRTSIAPANGSLEVVADDDGVLMPIQVIWPTDQPSIGEFVDVTISAAEHAPDTALPFHVGVADVAHEWGSVDGLLHPFDALERAYIIAGVRYDPAALAVLQADPRYAKSGWRITSKRKTAEWTEEAVYQPNLVVPFIDNEGRLAPKAIHNPSGIDPDTLFVFDAGNTRQPHVTWHHGFRDAFNIVNVQYQDERFFAVEPADGSPLPTDRIGIKERTLTHEYDTVDEIGPRPLNVRMDGLHRGSGRGITGFVEDLLGTPAALVKDHAELYATELFEVAGDGPQTGTIHGMLSTASVAAGDLVILDQDSLKNPNPAANARSGSRIVRILQRTFHVHGYEFEYMDVGAKLQPLAEPTIAIAQNAANPTNAVDVTVSDVPAGAKVTVFVGTDAAFDTVLREIVGVGAAVHTVSGLPSGTTIYAAGYSHATGRTSSPLSTPVSVATDADAPMVRDLTLTLQEDGSVLVEWRVNAVTAGLRLAYEAHAVDATPSLPNTVDVDASLGQYTIPAASVTLAAFTLGATPYPTFAAGSVSGTPGEQVVRTTSALSSESQAPLADLRWVDDGVTLTAWLDLQPRGVPVSVVNGLIQVGALLLAEDTLTTRKAGDASVFAGGVLGEHQYEEDVTLDNYRTSRVGFEVVLATGEILTFWTPAHDWNRVPEFATSPRVDGTVVSVEGDDDTISFKVERIDGGGTWSRSVDSWTGSVDVSLADASSNPGITSPAHWTLRVTLYSDGLADIDGSTLTAIREAEVIVGSTGNPVWQQVSLVAPSISSATAALTLDADSAPLGYTVEVLMRTQVGGDPWSGSADITASLSPAPTSPPTSATAYTFNTGYTRIAKDVSQPIVTVEVTARILNASGVQVATQTVTTNYYTVAL